MKRALAILAAVSACSWCPVRPRRRWAPCASPRPPPMPPPASIPAHAVRVTVSVTRLHLRRPAQLRGGVLVEDSGGQHESQPGDQESRSPRSRSSRRTGDFRGADHSPRRRPVPSTVTWADLTMTSETLSGHSTPPKGMALSGQVTATANVFIPQDPIKGFVTLPPGRRSDVRLIGDSPIAPHNSRS